MADVGSPCLALDHHRHTHPDVLEVSHHQRCAVALLFPIGKVNEGKSIPGEKLNISDVFFIHGSLKRSIRVLKKCEGYGIGCVYFLYQWESEKNFRVLKLSCDKVLQSKVPKSSFKTRRQWLLRIVFWDILRFGLVMVDVPLVICCLEDMISRKQHIHKDRIIVCYEGLFPYK